MEEKKEKKKFALLKRFGIAGFLFYLIKGIGWIIFWVYGFSMFKGCSF